MRASSTSRALSRSAAAVTFPRRSASSGAQRPERGAELGRAGPVGLDTLLDRGLEGRDVDGERVLKPLRRRRQPLEEQRVDLAGGCAPCLGERAGGGGGLLGGRALDRGGVLHGLPEALGVQPELVGIAGRVARPGRPHSARRRAPSPSISESVCRSCDSRVRELARGRARRRRSARRAAASSRPATAADSRSVSSSRAAPRATAASSSGSRRRTPRRCATGAKAAAAPRGPRGGRHRLPGRQPRQPPRAVRAPRPSRGASPRARAGAPRPSRRRTRARRAPDPSRCRPSSPPAPARRAARPASTTGRLSTSARGSFPTSTTSDPRPGGLRLPDELEPARGVAGDDRRGQMAERRRDRALVARRGVDLVRAPAAPRPRRAPGRPAGSPRARPASPRAQPGAHARARRARAGRRARELRRAQAWSASSASAAELGRRGPVVRLLRRLGEVVLELCAQADRRTPGGEQWPARRPGARAARPGPPPTRSCSTRRPLGRKLLELGRNTRMKRTLGARDERPALLGGSLRSGARTGRRLRLGCGGAGAVEQVARSGAGRRRVRSRGRRRSGRRARWRPPGGARSARAPERRP